MVYLCLQFNEHITILWSPEINGVKWWNQCTNSRRDMSFNGMYCEGAMLVILYIYTYSLLVISMLWQAIFESKGDNSSSAECRIRTWEDCGTWSPADWMHAHKPTDLSRIKLKKTWTRQPVPLMSEHSAQLTSLPFGFRTCLWWYTCLLLLISMLWHRQIIYARRCSNYIWVINNFIGY